MFSGMGITLGPVFHREPFNSPTPCLPGRQNKK